MFPVRSGRACWARTASSVRDGRSRGTAVSQARGLHLDPPVRRSGSAAAAGLRNWCEREDQSVPGRHGAGWHPEPDAGRHDHDLELGRLGAGLPSRHRRQHRQWSRRQGHSQHELPGPGDQQPVLLHDAEQHARAQSDHAAYLGRPLQVLRRLVHAESGAAAPYTVLQVPELVAKASPTISCRRRPMLPISSSIRRAKTNCTVCTTKVDGAPQLPPGKYVVEVVLPDGYER